MLSITGEEGRLPSESCDDTELCRCRRTPSGLSEGDGVRGVGGSEVMLRLEEREGMLDVELWDGELEGLMGDPRTSWDGGES